MGWDDREDTTIYKVVVNDEEGQYSIWPADRENPLRWRDEGMQGGKKECRAYIEAISTDRRPPSGREQTEGEQ